MVITFWTCVVGLLAVLSLVIFILNLVIAVIILMTKKLRRSRFNFLSVILAFTDMIAITLTYGPQRLPMYFYPTVANTTFGPVSAYFCNSGFAAIKWLQNFITFLICYYAYKAVLHPTKFTNAWKTIEVYLCGGFGFSIFALFAIGPFLEGTPSVYHFYNESDSESPPTACMTVENSQPTRFWKTQIVFSSIVTVLTGVLSAFLNLRMQYEQYTRKKRMAGSVGRSRRFVNVRMVIKAVTQLTFLVSNGIIAFLYLFGLKWEGFEYAGYVIADTSCAIAPVFILICNKEVRKRIFFCKRPSLLCCKKPSTYTSRVYSIPRAGNL